MNRRTYLAALGASGVTGLSGCAGLLGTGAPCEGSDCDVGMTGNSFVPREIEITVGETLRWRNTSARAHTVTAYENAIPDGAAYFATGGFESQSAALDAWADGDGALEGGGTYEHTFEVAGTYEYYCIPHEPAGMVGTVEVVE